MKWFKRDRGDAPSAPSAPSAALRSTRPAHHSDWRMYDDVADDYARAVAPQLAPIAADLVAFAEVPPDGRLLDVGTGTGAVLQAAGAFAAFGVDPSVPMLKHATGRFVAADAINLPFRDDTFARCFGAAWQATASTASGRTCRSAAATAVAP